MPLDGVPEHGAQHLHVVAESRVELLRGTACFGYTRALSRYILGRRGTEKAAASRARR